MAKLSSNARISPKERSKSTETPETEKMAKKKLKKEKLKKPIIRLVFADPKMGEKDNIEVTIEKKLITLYSLQQIDSQIDKIRIVRGELPLEVEDIEDEVAGIETRIEKIEAEKESMENAITEKKNIKVDSSVKIKRYEEQQKNVRNNREFDSLTKEIEFQTLEIQLADKRIKEYEIKLIGINETINESKVDLEEFTSELVIKKGALNDIIAETEKEEKNLVEKSKENQQLIEERLLVAYKKIRKNAKNGLAVVMIERDACGGCFNKIPPQHQLDIRMHKKIIVCEYCGRILVDEAIDDAVKKYE
jgi:predicted  nucleic acid-binding Zn-ribbon protein